MQNIRISSKKWVNMYLIKNYVIPCDNVVACISIAVSAVEISSKSLVIAAYHIIGRE